MVAPRYQQICHVLRREIASGVFQPNEPFPSEHDLMRRFGVARGTVRQAREVLRAEGVIQGGQGRQFSVAQKPLTQPLSELISFSAWAEGLGRVPSGRVVRQETGPAGPDGEPLGLRADEPVLRLTRLRSADGEPLMIERTVFPTSIGEAVAAIDLACSSIYAELAKTGITFASAHHQIDAVPASREDAALLGVEVGSPLLRVRRLGRDPKGHPIEWSDDRYRGDRVTFAVDNDRHQPSAVRRIVAGEES